MRQPARLLIVLATLLVVAGCERKPTSTQTADAQAAPGGIAVSEQEAGNTVYPSENATAGSVRLVNGHYEDAEQLVVDHESALDAIGDVDGDGREDRVVVLVTSTGGSGIFRDLYLLRRQGNDLRVSPAALLGDRVDVQSLRIENREVLVDLIVQGPDDPLCCPTQPAHWRFRLAGDSLVETTGQQQALFGRP